MHSASLEAQVANLADEITYYSHDLDDGLDSDLLSEKVLNKNVKIWSDSARQVKRGYGELPDECRRYFIIRCIIDKQVKDVVNVSERRILDSGVRSADDVRKQRRSLVQYSEERRRQNLELRDYLYQNLYYNPVVHEPHARASRMIEELFHYYLENPKQVGELSRKRARKEGWHRAICDYIAGMTDRYAVQEHNRLFGLGRGVFQ